MATREHLRSTVRISIRNTTASLLWITALVPVSMLVWFHIEPSSLYVASEHGRVWLARLSWIVVGLLALGLVCYPPFLPFLRLRLGETWRRLGTDRGPLYDGLARLRHLETHADRLNVGRMARQVGDLRMAMENLGRAFELDETHVSGRYQLGLGLAETGNYPEAAQLLLTVVRDDDKHAFGDALFHLGRILFRLHKDDDALMALRRHQTLFPGNRQVYLLIARVLADMGNMVEARAELEQAARPAKEGEQMTPHEKLARARSRVTILRKGKVSSEAATPSEDERS